jgi:hypothetical protein
VEAYKRTAAEFESNPRVFQAEHGMAEIEPAVTDATSRFLVEQQAFGM